MVDLTSVNKDTVALYDYDPYGRIVSSSGSYSGYNRYRFSTKWDEYEAGFSYYGYRHYSPDLGRWITRDPIGERGGLNLYGFVGNEPVSMVDKLGLLKWDKKSCECLKKTNKKEFTKASRKFYAKTLRN